MYSVLAQLEGYSVDIGKVSAIAGHHSKSGRVLLRCSKDPQGV
jgi:hypothetical protein